MKRQYRAERGLSAVSCHKVLMFTATGEMSAHADSCNVDTPHSSVCF
jgi:hypothetical protein